MKNIINLKSGSSNARSAITKTTKGLVLVALLVIGLQAHAQAQADKYTKPSWWFGAAAGANLNFYRGTTQELNADLTAPTAFRHGKGAGLYLAPLVEFHRPDSRWGMMFQAGYDSRKGKFEQVTTPCNCPADLSTKLSYITIEPSLRFAPFESNFYIYAGPRLAFNLNKSFVYELGINPAFPDQAPTADVEGDFSSINNMLVSMQIGAGYDIPLSSQQKQTQFVLSPFVAFHPYFGQPPRSNETWDVTTIRIGAALKFGRGEEIIVKAIPEHAVVGANVYFSIYSPDNIAVERRVNETFPIRNYVFFDLGSTQIPDRYVILEKNQVKDFKEDQLEVFAPKRLSGRSNRQMIAYYNVLNILGDRLGKVPSATVNLVGSSEKGSIDAKAMAESVKTYLVDIFGISASRITTEGLDEPKIPSEQPGGTLELTLLREGDRRVSVESSSPALLMEFQSGSNAPLKPVEISAIQTAPLDSYVTFTALGAKEAFATWSIEVKDEKGMIQNFGPFTEEKVSLPGKSILGTRPSGDFVVALVGKTKSGLTVRKETTMHMNLWTPSKDEIGMRYSVIFEFNQSKAIAMYKKYLIEVVTPKIPKNGKVIIHGYTDVIGDAQNNKELSAARAEEVRSIIESALSKAKRNDVKFEVYGFGEDENFSPFENKFPEERFYNRTVVIDIIPAKL